MLYLCCPSQYLMILSSPVSVCWVWVWSPFSGIQPHKGVMAGEWSGFPWSPVHVVNLKGPGSAPCAFPSCPDLLCPVFVHVMVPPGLVHSFACCPDSCVALVSIFFCLGLEYFLHIGAGDFGGSYWRPTEQRSQALLFSFSRLITRPHHPPSPFEKG